MAKTSPIEFFQQVRQEVSRVRSTQSGQVNPRLSAPSADRGVSDPAMASTVTT